jgi:hypothetical protein
VGSLVEGNRSRGTTPDSWTATPDWHGEPLDLGLAIDMLWAPKTGHEERDPNPPPLASLL